MEGFDLPMSFGKKSKAGNSNLKAKVENTKRADIPTPVKEEKPEEEVPGPSISTSGRKTEAEEEDDEEIGPIPPSATGKRKAEENDASDDEQEAEEEIDRLPISHEIILKDHTKVYDFMIKLQLLGG